MNGAEVIVCFPVDAAFEFEKKKRGFYRGLLQAVQQVMVLALKRRVGGLPHQGLSCLLGSLRTETQSLKTKEKTRNSVDEQVEALHKNGVSGNS